jgi:hypothetical protein
MRRPDVAQPLLETAITQKRLASFIFVVALDQTTPLM